MLVIFDLKKALKKRKRRKERKGNGIFLFSKVLPGYVGYDNIARGNSSAWRSCFIFQTSMFRAFQFCFFNNIWHIRSISVKLPAIKTILTSLYICLRTLLERQSNIDFMAQVQSPLNPWNVRVIATGMYLLR